MNLFLIGFLIFGWFEIANGNNDTFFVLLWVSALIYLLVRNIADGLDKFLGSGKYRISISDIFEKSERESEREKHRKLKESVGRYISTCPKCGKINLIGCNNCNRSLFKKVYTDDNKIKCVNCNNQIWDVRCNCGCYIYS